jgi:hypothetical protein
LVVELVVDIMELIGWVHQLEEVVVVLHILVAEPLEQQVKEMLEVLVMELVVLMLVVEAVAPEQWARMDLKMMVVMVVLV